MSYQHNDLEPPSALTPELSPWRHSAVLRRERLSCSVVETHPRVRWAVWEDLARPSKWVSHDRLFAREIVLDAYRPLVPEAVEIPAIGVPHRAANTRNEGQEPGCRGDSADTRI